MSRKNEAFIRRRFEEIRNKNVNGFNFVAMYSALGVLTLADPNV